MLDAVLRKPLPAFRLLWGVGGLLLGLAAAATAQGNPARYDIGTPTLQDVWVDPTNGSDANSGASRAQALRTLSAAWARVPMGSTLTTTGYRIRLAAGTYPEAGVPVYWESRHGSASAPVILEAADGDGTALLPSLNIFDCRYLYLVGLHVEAAGGDVLHCEQCDHFLMRRVTVRGRAPSTFAVQETVKLNQSQYVYIEDGDISGAWDNAVDNVAVQYGHVRGNRIHDSGDWCLYLKGGSAYFDVEGNEFYDCGTGGFTAGQGTGFEYMVSPWLHYEAYDLRFVNNIVHDTGGAGMGVNGGYDILMAHNTLYRIGTRSHVLEFVFGARSCDGDTTRCDANRAAGGWGTRNPDEPIPNRNVFVYNNLVYNPPGTQSQWQHFAIYGPRTPGAGSNIPSPARTDTNLQIRGNVLWNGPVDHPLGLGESSGCQDSNPTCNAAQLLTDNAVNVFEPQLVDPAHGNFRPAAAGNLFGATTYAPPSFPGGDRPQPPTSPPGPLANAVAYDFDGLPRGTSSLPGAFAGIDCTTASCGDGTLAAGCESCDDGNLVSGDGCDANCTSTGCGNGVVTSGESCDDGNVASGDGCDANCTVTACGNGILSAGEQCDDGNLVSGDGCDAACRLDCPLTPRSGCRLPGPAGGSRLALSNSATDSRDRLAWTWGRGAATSAADFGQPSAIGGASYVACVYGSAAGVPSLAWSATVPGGPTAQGACGAPVCWRPTRSGFRYSARSGLDPHGVTRLALTAGADGRARISLRGSGALLGIPLLPLPQGPSVTAQLANSNGLCWQATFSAPAGTASTTRFRDGSD